MIRKLIKTTPLADDSIDLLCDYAVSKLNYKLAKDPDKFLSSRLIFLVCRDVVADEIKNIRKYDGIKETAIDLEPLIIEDLLTEEKIEWLKRTFPSHVSAIEAFLNGTATKKDMQRLAYVRESVISRRSYGNFKY